jgi:hypothetical protein
LQICQTNYVKDLLEWVAPENLPDWLGGQSKGTLIDDVGPWSDPDVLRRCEGDLAVAGKALKHLHQTPITASADGGDLMEGFQSPRSAGWVIEAVIT